MNTERKVLRNTKLKYQEELASLKNYLRELTVRCHECGTLHEHVSEARMKAEHDARFYEAGIKNINARMKALKVTPQQ